MLRRLFTRRRAIELGGAAALSTSLAGPFATAAGANGSGAEDNTATAEDNTASAEEPGAVEVQRQMVLELLKPEIKPRVQWAGDLPVTGEITPETDVRFLLVHHTASTNSYEPDDVAEQIRDFYAFHTGPEKGWPDVAYNFFVDRFGGIWEARAGSVDGAVRGDATGGSQGHALLCSLIGDHSTAEVTPEAKAAMAGLLAWLSVRYEVDTTPGTTTMFTSRGSNLWAAGAEVTARTISGHRDMSNTSCPGDFAYNWIGGELPTVVTGMVVDAVSNVTEAARPATSTTAAATTTTTAAASTTTTTAGEAITEEALASDQPSGDGAFGGRFPAIAGGAAAVSAAVIGGLVRLRNRTNDAGHTGTG